MMAVFVFADNKTSPQIVWVSQVLYSDNSAQLETLLDPIQLFAAGNAVD
jgi:hypothetical protein